MHEQRLRSMVEIHNLRFDTKITATIIFGCLLVLTYCEAANLVDPFARASLAASMIIASTGVILAAFGMMAILNYVEYRLVCDTSEELSRCHQQKKE